MFALTLLRIVCLLYSFNGLLPKFDSPIVKSSFLYLKIVLSFDFDMCALQDLLSSDLLFLVLRYEVFGNILLCETGACVEKVALDLNARYPGNAEFIRTGVGCVVLICTKLEFISLLLLLLILLCNVSLLNDHFFFDSLVSKYYKLLRGDAVIRFSLAIFIELQRFFFLMKAVMSLLRLPTPANKICFTRSSSQPYIFFKCQINSFGSIATSLANEGGVSWNEKLPPQILISLVCEFKFLMRGQYISQKPLKLFSTILQTFRGFSAPAANLTSPKQLISHILAKSYIRGQSFALRVNKRATASADYLFLVISLRKFSWYC